MYGQTCVVKKFAVVSTISRAKEQRNQTVILALARVLPACAASV